MALALRIALPGTAAAGFGGMYNEPAVATRVRASALCCTRLSMKRADVDFMCRGCYSGGFIESRRKPWVFADVMDPQLGVWNSG